MGRRRDGFAADVFLNAVGGLVTAAIIALITVIWRAATRPGFVRWESLPEFVFRMSPSWPLAIGLAVLLAVLAVLPPVRLGGSGINLVAVAISTAGWPTALTAIVRYLDRPRSTDRWWEYPRHVTNWVAETPELHDPRYFTSLFVLAAAFGLVAGLVGQVLPARR